MVTQPDKLTATTTEGSAATAQSRGPSPDAPPRRARIVEPEPGLGTDYALDAAVTRAAYGAPYERRANDPIYRPLKIFTTDPSAARAEGPVALVNVPYEALRRGPRGRLFHVVDFNQTLGERYRQVDLDAPENLIRNGRDPSPSDWYFHQQMVYGVCSLVYVAFRKALGRHIIWGYRQATGRRTRLRIRPHAFCGSNAYYDEERGELCFGYYRAEREVAGRNLPGGFVFTCLSHDIIAHEVTHALLHGLRAHFATPSDGDVLAFHEALADLVAIFQHFSYDTVVLSAIRKSRGELAGANLLTDIARQFSYTTTGREQPLRSAVDFSGPDGSPKCYQPDAEPHALGSVLVSAVFEAYVTVFRRKTERYVRVATNGSGVLPTGELQPELQALLAEQASALASQFMTICVRAIDYCPPTSLRFGEFLRAMITADFDLVPDDPWGYREALIDAFRRRGIYPDDVPNLSEDALLWKPPELSVRRLKELSFARLKFRGDPAHAASEVELRRQACALARAVTRPELASQFGLMRGDDRRLGDDEVGLPTVHSIRSSRRVGPDGQIVFDLVAELTQQRLVRGKAGGSFVFYGGSTVIIDPQGEIRYVISKRVNNERRLKSQIDFMLGPGRPYWVSAGEALSPRKQLFRFLHD
ncbi:MAG: peptidase M4 [Pyrinomonadaceae bacterium]